MPILGKQMKNLKNVKIKDTDCRCIDMSDMSRDIVMKPI